MDVVAGEAVTVLMRWMHVASMALLVGGAAFLRLIAFPALRNSPDADDLAARFAAGFRPLVHGAIAGIIGSGAVMALTGSGHTRYYWILFGAKMLFAAYLFAAAFVMTRPAPADGRFFRRASDIVIPGLVIILISELLRRIF